MKRPMIYYSHPIAGENLPDVDFPHENSNCDIATRNVVWLRTRFPEIRWYCPGEVEIPIQVARQLKLLTVPQVLDIDFHIIKHRCRGGLLHPWEHSNGLEKEHVHLEEFQYPFTRLEDGASMNIWECDIEAIEKLVNKVLDFAKNNPGEELQ